MKKENQVQGPISVVSFKQKLLSSKDDWAHVLTQNRELKVVVYILSMTRKEDYQENGRFAV